MTNNPFPRVRLGDVCELHYGKALQAEKRLGGDVPVFSSAGITGYHNEALADSEGIIVGRKGTIGTVYYSPQPFFCIDTAYYILPNDKYDMQYLYYALKTISLDTLNEDSAVPGLNRNTAYSQIIPLPPLPVQRSIAATLSCLDDKIELNRRVNANLEAQAQALFRNYFSQRHKDTKGWREGRLGEIADITMGQSPDRKSYNETGNGTVFYQGRAEFGWRFPTNRLFTTEPKRMAQRGDILLSVRAPVGDINIANEDCCIGRGLAAIRGRYPSFTFYLMQTLKSKLEMFNNEGTVFGCINKDSLDGLQIIIPPDNVVNDFENMCSAFDIYIFNASQQSRALAAVRDTLLPGLMSGE